MEDAAPGPAMEDAPPAADPAGSDDGPASMPLGDVADARSAASRPRETEEGRGGEHCADGETGGDPPARGRVNPDGDGGVGPGGVNFDDAMAEPGQPSSEASGFPLQRSSPAGHPPQQPQQGGEDSAIAIDDGGDSSGREGGSHGEEDASEESASDDDDVVEITGTRPAPSSAGFRPVAGPEARHSFGGVGSARQSQGGVPGGRHSHGGAGSARGSALASEISAIASAASAGGFVGRAGGVLPPPSRPPSHGGGMPPAPYAAPYAPRYPPGPALADLPMPGGHDPTWRDLLPRGHDLRASEMAALGYGYGPGGYGYGYGMGGGPARRKVGLTLINPWEFTLTVEGLDCYGRTTAGDEVINGLRKNVKKISRPHVGKDGRSGALFERTADGTILPDDPALRESLRDDLDDAPGRRDEYASTRGKWRIPLGAYHQIVTYLNSDPLNVVEGISPGQLRVATLARERMDSRRGYPGVESLLGRGVAGVVARALAPYQRAGVEFVLDRDGRALLADEMGLGKTVQAIAAMSAFMDEWPLLILCPSTARYHWEVELRHWMGSESRKLEGGCAIKGEGGGDEGNEESRPEEGEEVEEAASSADGKENTTILRNDQINVMTSGKGEILKRDGSTRVVICSISLVVNLIESNRLLPGMFKAIIVDESHALKSRSTKRTRYVVPLLRAAERVLLLSGTPALARPSELWPQLSVLGARRGRDGDGSAAPGSSSGGGGVWCDEDEFNEKYGKGKREETIRSGRLAELHTMLTSTVMIRRMKADILKNLPAKVREKAYVKVEDEDLRNEFRTYMQLLRQGRGILGKMAREQHRANPMSPNGNAASATSTAVLHPAMQPGGDGVIKNKAVLNHLYKLTGKSKIACVTKMLKSWLADPTKGKLCIFAHHLDVLDEVSKGAGLSNLPKSTTKYIRIDGSTTPQARQEQILRFQTDPTVRIAMLGITAAGVAVTLTASSTVWFTELFWTPAIMIQAEDRCHRIGQQARVRCIYFVARGTLDEVLWKLIEKKFRDLGQFVEGKDNNVIALERELEDEDEEAILADDDDDDEDNEDGDGKAKEGDSKKRKADDVFGELADDLGLEAEIAELAHEEEDMLRVVKADEEEDEDEAAEDTKTPRSSPTNDGTGAQQQQVEKKPAPVPAGSDGSAESKPPSAVLPIDAETAAATTDPNDDVIDLMDEEDEPVMTMGQLRDSYRGCRVLENLRIPSGTHLIDPRLYSVRYPGPNYGLIMIQCNGRVCIKCHNSMNPPARPRIGSIIVALNGRLIPYGAPFQRVLSVLRDAMRFPPVKLHYVDDDDFLAYFEGDFLPSLPQSSQTQPTALQASSQLPPPARQTSEVIDLLDDDDD